MKRIVLTSLTATAMIALLAGCSSAGTGTATSADRQTAIDVSTISKDDAAAKLLPESIVSAGKLVVGVDPTYAPNEFKDKDGNPIGWEIDMIDAAAAKLGLTTDYRVAKFDNIVPSILGEKYDLGLGGYYDTKKRQEQLDMVDFFRAGNQFASPVDKPIANELDVCGLKVAAQNGGSAPLVYLPQLNEQCAAAGKKAIEILGYDTQDDATASVSLGRADAMVADSPVVGYAVKLSKGKLVTSDVYGSLLSGAPVMKDRGTFAVALQSALQQMLADGTYTKIVTYWGVEGGAIDEIQINGSTE
ncbi:ABC transporter substrate-binding protein [Glaciibacter psychrotolerans]|uniref:Polar amino acid transport system substrate-binding protein n=1 Tax=Glaciibacter psychrotolerans TaxID=670054 RepID=A0A7Z0ECV0_9MICO|nr:ABC transporter substrate-binding protein [Leifsonia psychrotolerans]NYJ18674.1 polar amino acid transport system substrate-binding protein [Leifsonia psychrotolerans]